MYLDRPTLNTIGDQSRSGIQGARRFFYVSQGVFRGVRAVITAGRRLDDLLFPGYAQQEVAQPVVIFAPPRSGTTFLHRLLSEDEDRFTHLRLYQTLLQSVSLTRTVEQLARLDRPLGGLLSRVLDAADGRVFGTWKDIHPMGFNQAEEDEGLLVFSLLSPGAFVFYPWIDDLPRAAWLDSAEPDVRRRVMAEYKSGVQRHLFAYGKGRTWLNKSVLLASRLESVTEAFPDARFIYLVRTPYETVPSFVSMFTAFWQHFYPTLPVDGERARQLARLAIAYTKRSLEFRKSLREDRYRLVRYTDLVENPRGVVEDVYRHFGWELGAAFSQRLDAQLSAARGYRPRHRYSLERYGLSRREIYDELQEVFDEFGFDSLLEDEREGEWIEDDALDPGIE